MLEFMKNKIVIPATVVAALAGFFSFRYINNDAVGDSSQNAIIQQTAMGLIMQAHYAPKEIDDKFSAKVFDKLFETLDYDKKFFLKSDSAQLVTYRNMIDNDILQSKTTFFDAINKVFVDRITKAETYYKDILSKPIKFTTQDEMQLDGKKMSFAKDEAEIKSRWEKLTKYRVLAKFVDLQKAEQDKLKDSAKYVVKTDVVLEKEARESIGKLQDRYFKRLKKLNDNDRFSMYMNSVTSTEDPHTNFFPPEDRKRFDEMMSGNFIGIGAQLQATEEGQTKVQMIITGSPSWKQGKLKVDDIIQKIESEGKPPVEIEGMELDDVVKLIRGKKDSEVKLHVKHKDGSNEVIGIIRGKVDLEDTYAKSAVIQNNGKKIGYIYLPEFYTTFNDKDGHKSGEDVKLEVQKLMKEGVDGIVLDLRNNGGGSLGDVVDMAGIFTGTGPVVQVRSRDEKVQTLSSSESVPIYTGPLAIMVNAGSASASEILAAAMQDYGRAVIIGSNTYGKGTVQKLVPLDPFVAPEARKSIIEAWMAAKNGDAEFDGIGSLKLTIQKFYRINGGSTQRDGVKPDIILPDVYEALDDVGERKDPEALPWDKIAASKYTTLNGIPNLKKLIENSKNRIAGNETFKLVSQTSARLRAQKDNNVVPLEITKFLAKKRESEDLNKKMDLIDSARTKLVITNVNADLQRVNLDTASKEKNEKWLKSLKRDVYIAETANVLDEWIKSIEKK